MVVEMIGYLILGYRYSIILHRLMDYYSQYPNIRALIDQCDLAAMRRCSAVPKLQLYQAPGTPCKPCFVLENYKYFRTFSLENIALF